MNRTRFCSGLLAFGFLAFSAPAARAHDPGLSSANVELGRTTIEVHLTFNGSDLARIAKAGLERVAERATAIEANGVALSRQSARASVDEKRNVEFDLIYSRPEDAGELRFRSLLLPELPFGHRQAFAVRDSNGHEIARRLLSAQDDSASFATVETGVRDRHSFLDFLGLGVRHILTGYDHLLFLFGLLLVARDFKGAAVVISFFTLAHSISLALSTFDLVHLPSRYVEPAIAGSIIYIGVENFLRPRSEPVSRCAVTFAFGLVHGLGFATVLRDMGVAARAASAVVPLVAFNSGVELGQLSVAAVLLPVIWWCRRRPSWMRIGVPACSAAIAVAGGYWFVERVFFGAA